MSANLRQKLAILLQDTERVPDSERLDRLMHLIESEVHNLEREHLLTFADLAYVRSRTIEVYNAVNMSSFSVEGKDHRFEPENLRTYASLKASLDFLTKEGLTKLKVAVKK